MKIIHICLACFYVEGMGYQENILPKIHAQSGNNVMVITSDYAFDGSGKARKKKTKEYTNKYNVRVKVIDKKKEQRFIPNFGRYNGLYMLLEREKPDIIFVHGGQFLSIKNVVAYAKKNPEVKLYLDQHGDYYNSPVNTFKQKLIHKVIYGHWIRKFSKLAERVYGVTPWRCTYLNDVYGVSQSKIELLVMGGDDEKIRFDRKNEIRENIRRENNISNDDFVIVTGGKIDKTKNIHLLMQAVSEIDCEKLKLIVFGQPSVDMEDEINRLAKNDKIRFIGWIDSDKAYDYFLASDLAIFPGTHSVLWEQACACGVPGIFNDWEGMHHVDVGGNSMFIDGSSIDEIKNAIQTLMSDKEKYAHMKNVAETKAVKEFSYREIAKRAIEGNAK